jgi:hypothetical protein
MYNFETLDELEGYAFYDAQIYCVSIRTIKNYIVVADVYKSVCFLMWRVCNQLTHCTDAGGCVAIVCNTDRHLCVCVCVCLVCIGRRHNGN